MVGRDPDRDQLAPHVRRQHGEPRAPHRFQPLRGELEGLEQDLADELLAVARPHDAVDRHRRLADPHRYGSGGCPLLLPFVGVSDPDRSLLSQPQLFNQARREDQLERAGVDQAVGRLLSNVGFFAVPPLEVPAAWSVTPSRASARGRSRR